MKQRPIILGLLLFAVLLFTASSVSKAHVGAASLSHEGTDSALPISPSHGSSTSDKEQMMDQQEVGWITAAWLPYNPSSNLVYERGLGSFLANCQYINMVNPVWFSLQDGETAGTTTIGMHWKPFYDLDRIQHCSESELLIIPVIKTTDDSPRLVHAMLDDNPAEHAELLAKIAAGEANGIPRLSFDGIEIDYEGIDWAHSKAFSEFVEVLAEELHTRGKLLVVTVQPKTGLCVGDGACAQDYARIGAAADYVKIMAYDNNGPPSLDPEHHAARPWVAEVLDYATKEIARNKLILGAPLYGYMWQRLSPTEDWQPLKTKVGNNWYWETITYDGALRLYYLCILNGDQCQASLNKTPLSAGKTPFVLQRVSYGHEIMAYYEDRISATVKVAQAQFHDIAGISFWHLGNEDLGVWPAVVSASYSPDYNDLRWTWDGTAKSGSWVAFEWIADAADELLVKLGWKFEPKVTNPLALSSVPGRFGQAYLPLLSGQDASALNLRPSPSFDRAVDWPQDNSCQMLLRVYRPDGTLYGSLDFEEAVGGIEVDDPMLGEWEARVSTSCTTDQDFLISAFAAKSDSGPEPEEYELQVSVQGSGEVLIEPNLPHYPEGELVKLTAQPESGWGFDSWKGSVTGNTNPLQLKMDSDKTVTAVFTKEVNGWIPIGSGSASGGGISADQFDSTRVDIAVAPDGLLYAAWADQGSGRIVVKAWNGTKWLNIGGSGLSCGGNDAESPAIAIGSDGLPVLVWAEELGNLEICAKRFDGQSWQSVGGGIVSDSRKDSRDASIAVAADGTMFVAWRDNSAGNYEVYVKRYGGSSWQELGGSATGGGISNTPSGYSGRPTIAVDLQNRPLVAYADDYSGIRQVYVERWNGTGWTAVGYNGAGGVSDSPGRAGHAVVKSDGGNIFLAWQDEGFRASGEIYVMQYNGSAWVEAGNGSAHQGGVSDTVAASGQPALNIDSEGRLCVAWNEGDSPSEIYVRCVNNGTWEELAKSGQGGGISDNSGNSWRVKIASSPTNVLYALWEDDSGGDDYEVFGLQWQR